MQQAYNEKHGIIPRSTKRELIEDLGEALEEMKAEEDAPSHILTQDEIDAKVRECEVEMKRAAKELRFEDAAHFRDLLRHYRGLQLLEEDL